MYCCLDSTAVAGLKKGLKNFLGILPGEDIAICIKEHSDKHLLTGYVLKDKGKSHFRLLAHGFEREFMDKCYQDYQDRLRSPTTKMKSLNYTNTVNEAYLFYKEWIYPLPPPSLNTTFTHMIASKGYIPSAVWATSKDFDLLKAEVLWSMMVEPGRVQPGDTARLFFGAGAPLDPSYDGRSLSSIKEDAIARRDALLEDDPEVDFNDLVHKQAWAIDTAPSSAAAEDIIPLHRYGAPPKKRILSEKGIAGGITPPCLSRQTAGILKRRNALVACDAAVAGPVSHQSLHDFEELEHGDATQATRALVACDDALAGPISHQSLHEFEELEHGDATQPTRRSYGV